MIARCRKCGRDYDRPEYQIKKREWICCVCIRSRARDWRKRRKAAGSPVISGKVSPEWMANYLKKYHASPEFKRRNAEQQRRYRIDPKLRMRHEARRIAGNAKKDGRLIQKPCVKCGSQKSQMHHPDYSKPLEIEWLCAACHRIEHSKL